MAQQLTNTIMDRGPRRALLGLPNIPGVPGAQPADPNADLGPGGISQTTGAQPAAGVDTSGPPDFNAKVEDLLSQIQTSGFDRAVRLQKMFLDQGMSINPDVLTPGEQQSLNAITTSLTEASDQQRNAAAEILTQRGMGRSSDIAAQFGQFNKSLLNQLGLSTAEFKKTATEQKLAQKSQYMDLSAKIQSALMSGQSDVVRSLLDAQSAAENRNLSEGQLQLQRDIFTQNTALSIATFTEEQRKSMRAEGFTEKQIDLAEARQTFESEQRMREFTASTDLANKNYDLQRQVQLGQLDIAGIRNNHDMALGDRAQQLAEEAQVHTAALDDAKFQAYARQLEQEYGLNVNRFELAKFIETGRLSNEIVNSQRALDLTDEKQRNDFLLGQGSLDLQQKLGWRELDIKYALGMADISVREESNRIIDWANRARIQLDTRELDFKIQQERSKRRGGLLGAILKGVVSIGAAVLSGGATAIISGVLGAVGAVATSQTPGTGYGTPEPQPLGNGGH